MFLYNSDAKVGGSGTGSGSVSDRDASTSSNTPRDERFSTPRGTARSSSVASSLEEYSHQDQWTTPRSARLDSGRKSYENSPRVSARSDYGDQQFATPRGGHYGMDDSNHSRGSASGGMDGSSHSQYASSRGQYGYQSYGYKGMDDSNHSMYSTRGGGLDGSSHSYYSSHGGVPMQQQHAPITQQPTGYGIGSHYDYQADAKNYAGGGYDDGRNMYDDDLDEAMNEGMLDHVHEMDVEDIFSYARHGRIADVERLLDKGIPVDVRDVHGSTLLIIACQNGNKKVAKSVLRRGGDINSRNHKGNTALHYCYQYGYGDTLGEYLVSKGADINARNNTGKITWDGI